MLSETACHEAAVLLDRLWREGKQVDHLPAQLRPANRTDGYAIQAAQETASDNPVVAWKIAATSQAGQAHINVDGPLAGRIFADRSLEADRPVSLRGNNMRVAELEFAFRLGQDVRSRAGGYSSSEVRDLVDGLSPAIEIPASRFSDFCAVGAPALIADNSCANLFVFGPVFSEHLWRERDLAAWKVTASVSGNAVIEGIGSNVLGDPWNALHWLVNEASNHGIVLKKGQFVSTGTCVTPIAVSEGDVLVADYGSGMRVTLTFA